ncbi:MAG: (2Fe-2S)-binding protein [Burkholderiales bacterium]|jgi:Rieske Fe-S protein|nr:(2Fe-2S)-binding protein [Burkholderiales bacterium]
MERRDFIRVCAATAIALQGGKAAADARPRSYARSLLADEGGRALRASQLAVGENYVFHYPFEGTPCFLLNLGKPTGRNVPLKTETGETYEWPGGVGPRAAIVAYSAICSHQLTYPTRQISFISYRDRSTASRISKPNMIHCCSEHSEYDPAAGARVLGGPAPQPLCAILLEYDAAGDTLTATGTLGGEMFNTFFSKYEMRLALEHGSTARAQQRVAAKTVVTPLRQFCKQQVRC